MHVVILAAGKGSRLGLGECPKPLAKLENGKTVLRCQLEALAQVISLDRVMIVVGYHKEKIMEAEPDLLYVYNSDFFKENTSKSLWKALRKLEDDVLWINGDVVFHPKIIEKIVEKHTTCMAVNQSRVGQEEVKYRTDGAEKIAEVSKSVDKAEGEAVGINLFMRADLPLLRQSLGKCQDQDFFEKGIEMCIQEGMIVKTVVIETDACVEIDFPADLERANHLIQRWK